MQGIDVSDGKIKTDEFGFFKKRKEKPLSLGIQCIPMASTTIFKMAHIGLCDWIGALSWKRPRKPFLFPHF